MKGRALICGPALAAIAIGFGGCSGHVDGPGTPEVEVVGEHAQLVAENRDWLKNYDGHCDVCFAAFELCEKAADGAEELDACELAMNTCVRGGLIKDDADEVDEDAGVVDEDAGAEEDAEEDAEDAEEDVDEDAGVDDEDEDDQDEDRDADEAADEAAEDDDEVVLDDAGVRVGGKRDRRDAGVDVDVDGGELVDPDAGEAEENDDEEDDDEENDDEEDAEVEEEEADADDARAQLVEDIQACLDEAGTCLDAGDPAECVAALKTCVKTALQGTFQAVCSREVGACRAEQAPRDALQSVEQLCAKDLGL